MLELNGCDFAIERKAREAMFQMKAAHFHSYYEIYYLLSGKRKFFVDHSVHIVNQGEMIAVSKGSLHQTTYLSNEKHERVVVIFNDTFLQPFINIFGKDIIAKCFGNPHIYFPNSKRSYLEDLLTRLESEYNIKDKYSEYKTQTLFFELIIFILRCQEQYYLEVEEEITDTEKDIQNAARYISQNYSKPVTLEETARVANMSVTYFSKKFKKVTGFGFKEYLTNIRLKEASSLLAETDKSITQIALNCGFNDGNYFGDVFKRIFGLSPYQYRKNQRTIS